MASKVINMKIGSVQFDRGSFHIDKIVTIVYFLWRVPNSSVSYMQANFLSLFFLQWQLVKILAAWRTSLGLACTGISTTRR